MNWMHWLSLALLAPGLVWCVAAWLRERDLRLALVVCFLAALVGRQLVGGPPEVETLSQSALGPGAAPLWLDLASHFLASLAAIAIGRSVVERNRAEQVHWQSMEALRSLTTFFNTPEQPFEEALDELLSLGCKHLRLDIGLLSRVEGERYDILALHSAKPLPVSQGERVTLDETLCAETLRRDQLVAIENTAASPWKLHPGTARFGFASYLGVPVRRGTTPIGTLCFAGGDARKRFSDSDKQILGLLANWVDNATARHEAQQAVEDLTRRQQVCLELSQRALQREEPELLSDSLARLASALDIPFAAVLQADVLSQGEDGVELRITAETGWNEGTLGATVRAADSFLGDVLFKGETVVVDDFAKPGHGAQPAFFETHPITATACVPISKADRQVGVLCVCAAQARSFANEELDFLRLGANLIASALTTGTVGDEAPLREVDRRDLPNEPTPAGAGNELSAQRVPRRSHSTDQRRLPIDASIRALEADLQDEAAVGVPVSLDLAASASEVRMFRYEFERIVWGLVLQGAELANGDGELRVETRLLAPNGAGATPETYVTLGVRVTHASLDSGAMSDLLDREATGSRLDSRKHSTARRRLSLPRIRRLLRAMGGDISAHSGEREGTTITAYLQTLPARSERDAARKPAPIASSLASQ